MIKDSILITLPDHSDPYLLQTIKSAINNSNQPNLLYFSVFSTNSLFNKKDFENIKNINVIFCDSQAPLGVGISRSIACYSRDYNCEYMLQVDAHALFKKGWDDDLRSKYAKLNNLYGENVLISSDPPVWWVDKNNKINIQPKDIQDFDPNNIEFNFADSGPVGLKALTYPDGSLNIKSTAIWPVDWKYDHIEAYCLHGGLIFAKKIFFDEFVYDPLLFWNGEQEVLALRAWTRGYRFFAFKNIPIASQRKQDQDIKMHEHDWRKHFDKIGKEAMKSKKRYHEILKGDIIGYWGATDIDSLKAWHKLNGTIEILNGND